MLILSRTMNQSIIITQGDQRTEIEILSLCNGKVRLGFTASSRNIIINRKEIQDQIDKEKQNGAVVNNANSTSGVH